MTSGNEVEFLEHLSFEGLLQENSKFRLAAALKATKHPLDAVVTELGLMREDAFAKAVAEFFGVGFIEQPARIADADSVEAFGIGFLTANSLIPVIMTGGKQAIATPNPFDRNALAMIEYQTGQTVDFVVATRAGILAALAQLELAEDAKGSEHDRGVNPANESDLDRLRDYARQEPVVKLLSRIIQVASDAHASDIHIEPFEHELRIRIRVDGVLQTIETSAISMLRGIVTRIKILAGLDISEQRLPQDGRMRATVRGQEMDLRVSISPVIHGEATALRVLDRSVVALDLDSLGFAKNAQRSLERLVRLPNGIVLITGPTGSGKTTTLYALLSLINDQAVKIFTVEDPVEYRLAGITQLQINSATSLTFARALRSILRQDPDIILIGEIRDKETAETAIQAALTGHLVLSTLHTNSAAGAITRLRDMGVDNYLIGATLKGVAAQRLLRKLCNCDPFRQRASCNKCNGSGLFGRTVAYEIAPISDVLARQIADGSSEAAILDQIAAHGVVSLSDHAVTLAGAGVTSLSEAVRVSMRFEDPVE